MNVNQQGDTATPAPNPDAAAIQPDHTPRLSAAEARDAVKRFHNTRNGYALLLLGVDLAVFALGQWLAVAGRSLGLNILGAIVTWVAIVRLFIVGHDACHQAFTTSRRLNDCLGRLAFLVSLTPYSLWRVGHNIVHHGFNNLRGRDFVWEPKTPEEYGVLSPGQQRLERLYRSAAGAGIYYFVEIWWRRLYFPNRRSMPVARPEFRFDSYLVTAIAAAWLVALLVYARAHEVSFYRALLLAFVIPFVLWNWTVALVVYLHHTHPDIPWYDNKRQWQEHFVQLSSTLHVVMPWPLGPLMHHIMEHPVHHLDTTIPLYGLKHAQQRLSDLGADFTRVPFTLGYYLRCVRACKLYDYQRHSWVAFPNKSYRLRSVHPISRLFLVVVNTVGSSFGVRCIASPSKSNLDRT